MQVKVEHTGSTFNPDLNPTIYSPAISTWVDLTNAVSLQKVMKNQKCKFQLFRNGTVIIAQT